jgi:hypothetical protein
MINCALLPVFFIELFSIVTSKFWTEFLLNVRVIVLLALERIIVAIDSIVAGETIYVSFYWKVI